MHFPYRTPTAIVDPKGRMLAILAGRPDDVNWEQDVLIPATALLEEIREEGDACGAWSKKQLDARRGDFVSITTGVSYGGGQDVSESRCLSFSSSPAADPCSLFVLGAWKSQA